MLCIKPSYLDQFYCSGEGCAAPCAAPADMTWTRSMGNLCESGFSLACPQGAQEILLPPERTVLQYKKDSTPSAPLYGITQDQLDLMIDAKKTMTIIVQNRSLAFRSNVMLALIYGCEFEPMISSGSRYAYDELDWGFTEQPYRQLSYALTAQGDWEMKRSNLLNLLIQFHDLCQEDTLLQDQLHRAIDMVVPLTGQTFKSLRDEFDNYMKPREYLFENLLLYYVHRYFLSHAQEATVLPGVKLAMVSFAAIRSISARLYCDTGVVTEDAFAAICRHWARCVEENSNIHAALEDRFLHDPLYSQDSLQRMLWQ